MHSANLDRCRYLHKVLAVWYIHLGLCEAYTCLLIRNISAKGNRVQIFNTDFNTFVWSPLNLNSEAVSFVFSVTLTAHAGSWFSVTLTSDAGSLVYCDLDLFCLEFSFCNFDLLCWEFGFLWPWHLMKGVRFSVTLLSEAGILVSCNYDLSCWEFGFCDFDRLVSSVIIKFWTYGSITG